MHNVQLAQLSPSDLERYKVKQSQLALSLALTEAINSVKVSAKQFQTAFDSARTIALSQWESKVPGCSGAVHDRQKALDAAARGVADRAAETVTLLTEICGAWDSYTSINERLPPNVLARPAPYPAPQTIIGLTALNAGVA